MDKEEIEALCKYRRDNFKIKIEDVQKSMRMFENEIRILVTHNGYQYQGIAVDPVELEKLVEVLQVKLKEIKEK